MICSKCNIEKENNEFYSKRTECIICSKEYRKMYYSKNSEKQKLRSKLQHKNNHEYYQNYKNLNRDKVNGYAKVWRDNNPEKSIKSTMTWRNNNREKYNNYQNLIRSSDNLIKLSNSVRNRINNFLKVKNLKKNNKTFDILGCSHEFLKEYIEKKFTDGMCWDRMGKEIHIDHIIPLSFAKSEDEIYKLCHYTNLQPLWAEDNLKKSNKILKKI